MATQDFFPLCSVYESKFRTILQRAVGYNRQICLHQNLSKCHPVIDGGYPHQGPDRGRGYPIRSRKGVPSSSLDRKYPPIKSWMGVPPVWNWIGYSHRKGTWDHWKYYGMMMGVGFTGSLISIDNHTKLVTTKSEWCSPLGGSSLWVSLVDHHHHDERVTTATAPLLCETYHGNLCSPLCPEKKV